MVFIGSCGVTLDIYQWNKILLNNYDLSTENLIGPNKTVTTDNFAVKIALNSKFLTTLTNSLGVSARSNVQTATSINSLFIYSVNDFTAESSKGSEVHNSFLAGRNKNNLEIIENFIESFGQASNVIDTCFQLQFIDKVNIIEGDHQFTIVLYLSNGDSLKEVTPVAHIIN